MRTKEVKVGTYWRHKTRSTIYAEVTSHYHLDTAGPVVRFRDQYGNQGDCNLSVFCQHYEPADRLAIAVLFGEV